MTTIEPKKKLKLSSENTKSNMFDLLHDDLILCVLCNLSSSASSPADFVSVLITCKRLNRLGLQPLVLSRAGQETLAVTAKNWSESSHRFLVLCVNSGNIDACYALGMIRFYCLQNRSSGLSLMVKAAIKSHRHALYSLAVIQFNGSGGSKSKKNIAAGVALCTRATKLGHLDALRELVHCLQDGYGISRYTNKGHRLLIQAYLHVIACTLHAYLDSIIFGSHHHPIHIHPVNRFLREWFGFGSDSSLSSGRAQNREGRRMCSHERCGRPETRAQEFRRCFMCGKVKYCSRGCQALDWKLKHKFECLPDELRVAGENAEMDVMAG